MTRPHTPRTEGWEQRLDAWVQSRRRLPFGWGSNDCIAFAASAVEALTGASPLPLLPPYETEEEADARLAERGGLEAAIVAAMEAAGFPPCGPGHAGRGDIVMARVGNDTPLAVCLGAELAIAGPEGMAFIRRGAIIRAWAI
jgi:hypothetical protein